MTAINITRTPDAVHMSYDTKGTIGDIGIAQVTKCVPVPHIHAAVATRGHAQVLHVIAGEMSQHLSYDDMKDGIVRRLKDTQAMRRVTPQWADLLETEFDAFFIGWGKDGPDAFAVFSHNRHGFPAHQILDIGTGILTPTVPQDALQEISNIAGMTARAIAALSLQTSIRPDIVGGHMIETIVDRHGIHSRCIGKLQSRNHAFVEQCRQQRDVQLSAAFGRPSVPEIHNRVGAK